jgi:hypothetical protein
MKVSKVWGVNSLRMAKCKWLRFFNHVACREGTRNTRKFPVGTPERKKLFMRRSRNLRIMLIWNLKLYDMRIRNGNKVWLL